MDRSTSDEPQQPNRTRSGATLCPWEPVRPYCHLESGHSVRYNPDMMTAIEVEQLLGELGLEVPEAAPLLGVSDRTVRRWLEGDQEIPGPAEAALRAWRRLHQNHLAWRPDSLTILQEDPERIAAHRQHAIDLAALLQRVEARGGPKLSWSVRIPEGVASLDRLHVSFYKLQNGGFSLSVYSRRDGIPPDVRRDWGLIEDAAYCIAQAFEKQGRRADALDDVAGELRSICSRDADARLAELEVLTTRIETLAHSTREGDGTTYRQFAGILAELTKLQLGAPSAARIHAVARAYGEAEQRLRVHFVRSGRSPSRLTKSIETDVTQVGALIQGRQLKYLGKRLPVMGDSATLDEYRGPDFVVLEVPSGTELTDIHAPGLYLIEQLDPSAVRLTG